MTSILTDRFGGPKGGLAFKAPCVAASTGNLTLSGEQTVDGVSAESGDRVLAKDQDDATENGIYVVATTAWARAKDFDGNDDIVKGTRVAVTDGSVGSGEYKVTTDNPIVVDTSNIMFEFSIRDGSEAGFVWTFDSLTTDADPGAGEFRFNNATIASATAIYIDNADYYGNDVSAWIDTFDDSTSATKGVLKIMDVNDPTIFAMFTITGSVTDGTGYRKLTAVYLTGNGTFTAGNTFSVVFQPSGSAGSISGPASTTAGHLVTWNSTAGAALSSGIPSTSVLRSTDIGSTAANGVQAYSSNALLATSTAPVLTVGFPSTSENLGTKSTAETMTLDLRAGHFQHVTVVTTALAIAPQADVGSIALEVTIGATTASITTTAYTRVTGAFTQVSGDDFIAMSMKTQNFSLLSIQPLQST